jgi:hypothetical protein
LAVSTQWRVKRVVERSVKHSENIFGQNEFVVVVTVAHTIQNKHIKTSKCLYMAYKQHISSRIEKWSAKGADYTAKSAKTHECYFSAHEATSALAIPPLSRAVPSANESA